MAASTAPRRDPLTRAELRRLDRTSAVTAPADEGVVAVAAEVGAGNAPAPDSAAVVAARAGERHRRHQGCDVPVGRSRRVAELSAYSAELERIQRVVTELVSLCRDIDAAVRHQRNRRHQQ